MLVNSASSSLDCVFWAPFGLSWCQLFSPILLTPTDMGLASLCFSLPSRAIECCMHSDELATCPCHELLTDILLFELHL
jgi:hypothetical protein